MQKAIYAGQRWQEEERGDKNLLLFYFIFLIFLTMAKNKEIKEEKEPKSKEENKHLTSTVFLIIFLLITIISFIFFPILISLILFILILFPILLYIILGKLTKRWVLSFFISLIIYVILLAILVFWIYTDTTNLITNMQQQPKYLLYREGNTIPFGYSFTSLDFNIKQGDMPFKQLSTDEIRNVVNTINKKDKFVIIFKKEFFNPLPETIELNVDNQDFKIPKATAFEILQSQEPDKILLQYVATTNQESKDIPPDVLAQIQQGNITSEMQKQFQEQMPIDKSQIKAMVLGLMAVKTAQSQGIDYLFDSLANNNLDIKPTYIGVWVFKHLPIREVKPFLPPDLQQELNNAMPSL